MNTTKLQRTLVVILVVALAVFSGVLVLLPWGPWDAPEAAHAEYETDDALPEYFADAGRG